MNTTLAPRTIARYCLRSWSFSIAACIYGLVVLRIATIEQAHAADPIDFGLQVRPILAEKCFHCHGPDPSHREANLRLDDEASAKSKAAESIAVVPGKPNESELWLRINSDDSSAVMPPPSTHKSLSAQQKEWIRQWIAAGAPWGTHWSFAPPTSKPLPVLTTQWARDWARSPIDAWVAQSLERRELSPAPRTDAYTLCRRLHLDLIGLPPTVEASDRFAQAFDTNSQAAIESLVDELLGRPQFGEHWARVWLDLARYADTKGYEKDLKRDMWPFRDWVIESLNADKPFDQFTIEQLAGDLLENAKEPQRIATAFHRATLANDEGGTDDEEFRIAAVKDRIDTTIQVWMGLTMGCAKCHSHKYDPISIEDYYRFYAIFNQTEDADRYDDEPRLTLPSFEQQSRLNALANERTVANETLRSELANATKEIESRWHALQPVSTSSESGSELLVQADQSVLAAGTTPDRDVYEVQLTVAPGKYQSIRLETLTAKLKPTDAIETVGRSANDPNFVLSELELQLTPATESSSAVKSSKAIKLEAARADVEQSGWPIVNSLDGDAKTGWAIAPEKNQSHWAVFTLSEPLECTEPMQLKIRMSQQFGGGLLIHRFRWSLSTEAQSSLIINDRPNVAAAKAKLREIDDRINGVREQIAKLPIMRELSNTAKRTTRVHNRGNFLDPGDTVEPALLPSFITNQQAGMAPNRLAAAQWLVSPSNPLTPRVQANRIWAQLFGRGLVESEEDFGSQGALPSHPELLDHLAVQYRDSFRWSLKRLLKYIVTSNSYQQAFVLDDARRERDPRNVWLSRGPRFRLSAEAVRDQALAVSGLLSNSIGGPPVMPPQPDGIWRSTYNGSTWVTSEGNNRYRRGLYTFWKRTTPYPSMETFDASTREVCQIRRISTNTPLQALVTLNDPVYTEASAALAQRVLLENHPDNRARIGSALRMALGRPPRDSEIDRLTTLLDRATDHFEKDSEARKSLLSVIHFERSNKIDDVTLAAWTIVANAILNLDEFVTRT